MTYAVVGVCEVMEKQVVANLKMQVTVDFSLSDHRIKRRHHIWYAKTYRGIQRDAADRIPVNLLSIMNMNNRWLSGNKGCLVALTEKSLYR